MTLFAGELFSRILFIGLAFLILWAINKLIKSKAIDKIVNLRVFGICIALLVVGSIAAHKSHPKETSDNLSSPWTEEAEAKIYNAFYNEAEAVYPSEETRKKFVGCAISRMKRKYPNGVSGIPKDSLQYISQRIGQECGEEFPIDTNIPWTPKLKAAMKQGYKSTQNIKDNIPAEYMDQFCDCIISNLEQVYPSGLPQKVPDSVNIRLGSKCAQQLK